MGAGVSAVPVISSGRFIVSRFWPLGLAATIASVAGAVGADVVAALVCALALREHEVFRLVEKRAVADFAEREIDDAVVRLFWDELRPLQRLPFLHAPRRPSRRRPPRRARELALRPWARTAAADEQRRPKASRGRDPNHPQQSNAATAASCSFLVSAKIWILCLDGDWRPSLHAVIELSSSARATPRRCDTAEDSRRDGS